jgi:hypothetical protein
LSQYNWLINHLRVGIFRLGRLQFELPQPFTDEIPDEWKKDVNSGDMFLNVHIPRGGRLDEADCLDSFDKTTQFFPNVLKREFKAFVCTTWLFDPVLNDLLPPDSNILSFQRLFTITAQNESYDVLRFVFANITKDNIKDAPTDTSFRKRLVEHILSGGIMRMGYGYRMADFKPFA